MRVKSASFLPQNNSYGCEAIPFLLYITTHYKTTSFPFNLFYFKTKQENHHAGSKSSFSNDKSALKT